MSEKAGATAGAHQASVSSGWVEGEWVDADPKAEAAARIAAHEAKVAKAEEFLASAKQALAAEKAAQKESN